MRTAYSDNWVLLLTGGGGSCLDNKYAKVSARGCTIHSAVQRVCHYQSLALGNTLNQYAVQGKRRRCDVRPASGLHVQDVSGGTHLNGSNCLRLRLCHHVNMRRGIPTFTCFSCIPAFGVQLPRSSHFYLTAHKWCLLCWVCALLVRSNSRVLLQGPGGVPGGGYGLNPGEIGKKQQQKKQKPGL